MNSCLIFGTYHAGNHLVMRLMDLLGLSNHLHSDQEGWERLFAIPKEGHQQFMFGIAYGQDSGMALRACGIKSVYIIRDPRDVAISVARTSAYDNKCSFDDELLNRIGGLGSSFEGHDGWRLNGQPYTTSYERLVGNHGGGDDDSQMREIRNICRHLNHILTNEKLESVREGLYTDRSHHLARIPPNYPEGFIGGHIGNWKNLFKEKHRSLWEEELAKSECLQTIMELI